MYARIANFQADPANLGGLETHVGSVAEQVRALPGARAVYAAWRTDGAGVVTAIYESEAAAENAAPLVQEIWLSMAQYLTSLPASESYDTVVQMKG